MYVYVHVYICIFICIHLLFLVGAVTGDLTCNLGILERCSNQLSYLARAATFSVFLKYIIFFIFFPLLLGTTLPDFRSCNPPWLRLSERTWDHKPLRRQSLSPWQGHHLCPLYFILLGPRCMTG